MSAADDMEFISVLGCRVRLVPGPDHMDPRGAMLVLQMEDVGDGRMASLYLSPDNAKDLEYMLRRWASELSGKWAESRPMNEPVGEYRECEHGFHHPPWWHSCDGCFGCDVPEEYKRGLPESK